MIKSTSSIKKRNKDKKDTVHVRCLHTIPEREKLSYGDFEVNVSEKDSYIVYTFKKSVITEHPFYEKLDCSQITVTDVMHAIYFRRTKLLCTMGNTFNAFEKYIINDYFDTDGSENKLSDVMDINLSIYDADSACELENKIEKHLKLKAYSFIDTILTDKNIRDSCRATVLDDPLIDSLDTDELKLTAFKREECMDSSGKATEEEWLKAQPYDYFNKILFQGNVELHDMLSRTNGIVSSIHAKRGTASGKIAYVFGQCYVSANVYYTQPKDFVEFTNKAKDVMITGINQFIVVLLTKKYKKGRKASSMIPYFGKVLICGIYALFKSMNITLKIQFVHSDAEP